MSNVVVSYLDRLTTLCDSAAPVDPEELDAIWRVLPVARIEDLYGTWEGTGFETGHRAVQLLKASGWYGKTFNSRTDVKPLVCRDANGELYSDATMMNGEASLWMVEFQGEVTATMVYDGLPVLDHFKKVDDDVVLGVMNGKDDGLILDEGHRLYFLLRRVQ